MNPYAKGSPLLPLRQNSEGEDPMSMTDTDEEE
jgi:hypothetical protein